EVRLPLLQPIGARFAVPERVQALGFVSAALADADQRGVPELSRPRAADALEHRPDDAVRSRLQRTVHTRSAGHSEPHADHLRARSDAAGKRLLRPLESARSWLPQDLQDRAVSVLGSDGSLQRHELELYQVADDDLRPVART